MSASGTLILVIQSFCVMLIAPLLSGIVKKVKAVLQNRQGAGIFQPYKDILKLFRKEEVIPETASWVFEAAPLVSFSAIFAVCFLIPVAAAGAPAGFAGDVIALVFLLALPRFFTALGGLDAGTSFGGMGSSREAMISSIAEPVVILSLFTVAVQTGVTSAGDISLSLARGGWSSFNPAAALAFAAFFLVTLAECGRLPVDNPATHLELTMVHEAMILEYSGRSLALIEWASMTKLAIFLTLMANMFLPWGIASDFSPASIITGAAVYLLKIFALALALAFVETSTAKLRLFRVPDFLGIAFVLALLGLLSQGVVKLGL